MYNHSSHVPGMYDPSSQIGLPHGLGTPYYGYSSEFQSIYPQPSQNTAVTGANYNYLKTNTNRYTSARQRYNPLASTASTMNSTYHQTNTAYSSHMMFSSESTNRHHPTTSYNYNHLNLNGHTNPWTSSHTPTYTSNMVPPYYYNNSQRPDNDGYNSVTRTRPGYCVNECCQPQFQNQNKLITDTGAKLNLKEFLESWNENNDDPSGLSGTANVTLPDLVLSNGHSQTNGKYYDVDKILNDDSFWFNISEDVEVTRLVEELNRDCKLKMRENLKHNSVQPLSTDNRSAEPSNGNSDDIIAVQCQIQIDDKNNLHVTYQKRKT